MTDGIRVNHEALITGADNMKSTMERINNRLDVLENELAPLRNDWSGRAQETYVVAKGKWDAAIAEMQQLLKETSDSVRQSQIDYSNADARGAAQFGG
ncbi:WXG100 family type VII secretion target [Nocardioides rubriscoriae]|uniref:WXG100 family type VII secretion target n=1 Tax=Nocardioides rubriscoriae TaxID=642762 RepID=UPI0011E04A58|nr:WXG100 family type VII secretion target [Nocardioides rubriscoriae]